MLGRTYTLTLLFILLQRRTIGDDLERRPTRRRFAFPKLSASPQPSNNISSADKTSSGASGKRRKPTKPTPIKVTTHKQVRFLSPVPTPLELQEFERQSQSRAALSPSLFTLGSFQSDAGGEVEDVAEKGEYRGEGLEV